jgi:hypothetical protein
MVRYFYYYVFYLKYTNYYLEYTAMFVTGNKARDVHVPTLEKFLSFLFSIPYQQKRATAPAQQMGSEGQGRAGMILVVGDSRCIERGFFIYFYIVLTSVST